MEEFYVFALFAIIFWGFLISRLKKKLGYRRRSEKMHGEVVSWYDMTSGTLRYYHIEVRGDDGRTYKIVTDKKVGKKYKKRSDAEIYVPADYEAPYDLGSENHELEKRFSELRARKHSGVLTEDEEVELRLFVMMEENRQKIMAFSGAYDENRVRLAEELRITGDCLVLGSMGILFALMSIGWVIAAYQLK